jgi:hypothetical protein
LAKRAALPPPSPPAPPPCTGCVVSNVSILATLTATGEFKRKRYAFTNVFLQESDTLSVYLPPAVPLPDPFVADTVHGNATVSVYPTVTMYTLNGKDREYLNINYMHANSTATQPRCKRWEDRPVYVLYMPHASNIWHMLNDALLGVFQTLREERLLPLAEIDEEGNMVELTSGVELKCQRVFDLNGWNSYRRAECRNATGLIMQTKCDRKVDEWCRPGVTAVQRGSDKGPILLLAQGSKKPLEKWRHLFRAISYDIREWDSEVGTCFKELYIGKSNTLNLYYATINETTAKFGTKHTLDLRRAAMGAFTKLVRTAEVQKRIKIHTDNPKLKIWNGYDDPDLEILRQGIDRTQIKALEYLRRVRRREINEDADMEQEHKREMKDAMELETHTMRQLILRHDLEGWAPTSIISNDVSVKPSSSPLEAPAPAPSPFTEEFVNATTAMAPNPLPPSLPSDSTQLPPPVAADYNNYGDSKPVVTYIWRSTLRRCAVNEADILEWILSRYDVIVKVTTFEEPFLEMMDLMNSTDIMMGMHGAGWTNGLFLKPGAGGLQIHPYGWLMVNAWRHIVTIRGESYENIVRFHGGPYEQWINPYVDHAFIRKADFESLFKESKKYGTAAPAFNYTLHPQLDWPRPDGFRPGAHWIYQNTLVSIDSIAPFIDRLMAAKGIPPIDRLAI